MYPQRVQGGDTSVGRHLRGGQREYYLFYNGGVVPELRGLASSSDASVLRDIPEEIEKIVERLVRRW
jgi:hypothetical protein